MRLLPAELEGLTAALRSEEAQAGVDSQLSRGERKARGAFFTPQPLVRFVVDKLFDCHGLPRDLRGHAPLRVLDPAAGDGRFLIAAREELLARGMDRRCAEASLIAIERHSHFASELRARLGAGAQVFSGEALLSGLVDDGSVDLVVGNPPYLRSIQLGEVDAPLRKALRSVYAATSQGEWDLYAAFMEQGLRWLAPGGHMAWVVPSRFWSASWARGFRELLHRGSHLRALVDFGDGRVFADATTYTSLLFAGRDAGDEVQLARPHGSWSCARRSPNDFGAKPWSMALGRDREVVERLRKLPLRLAELVDVVKGTGTNADSVFVLDDTTRQAWAIEEAIVRPVLRGRDIGSFALRGQPRHLLFPYRESCELIAPAQLQADAPGAWRYLAHHRETLSARERGRFAGEHFYCFGRPQNLRFLCDPAAKLVLPDVTREGRAHLDHSGAMLLDSAYAIRLKEAFARSRDERLAVLRALCWVFNTPLVRFWLLHHGVPLRGGYTRMKTRFLSDMPVPSFEVLRALGAGFGGDAEREHDALVAAFGLGAREWRDVQATASAASVEHAGV